MSNWQPQPQGLSDLLQLLREAINPTDSQNVQQVKELNTHACVQKLILVFSILEIRIL